MTDCWGAFRSSILLGNGCLAQANGSNAEYYLGDALSSVRQLTDSTGAVTFAQAYDPNGVVNYTAGAAPD